MWEVEECGHNDIEYRKGRKFKKKLKRFFDEQVKGKQYKESVEEEEEEDTKNDVDDHTYFDQMDQQIKVNSVSSAEHNTVSNNFNNATQSDEMFGKKRKSLSNKVSIFESDISVAATDK